eukprot:250843-Hanusia_phi.AAC.1
MGTEQEPPVHEGDDDVIEKSSQELFCTDVSHDPQRSPAFSSCSATRCRLNFKSRDKKDAERRTFCLGRFECIVGLPVLGTIRKSGGRSSIKDMERAEAVKGKERLHGEKERSRTRMRQECKTRAWEWLLTSSSSQASTVGRNL